MQFSGQQTREMLLATREPAKILIVDDDAYFRELIRRLMTAAGYEVMEARSTNEAESFLRLNPALAIIDYRLPNTDGAAWIKSLRERGVKFPIVFCSGSSYSPQTLANIRNILRVELIVRKPIRPNEFVRQLESLLPAKPEPAIRQEEDTQRTMAEKQPDSCTPQTNANNAFQEQRVLHLPTAPQTAESEEALISDILGRLLAEEPAKEMEQGFTLDQIHQSEIHAHRERANRVEITPVQDMRPLGANKQESSPEEQETRAALKELAFLYLAELPATVKLIRDEVNLAQQNGEISGLQNAAERTHQLHGTAGSLGFNRLSVIAGELEDCLREEISNDIACPLFNCLAINSLIEQLATLINDAAEETVGNEEEKTYDFLQSNHRALLIDSDQEENDIFCTAMNEQQDWRAIGLTGCSTIFAVLDKYQPTLLLIKAELADTTGFDLCRQIRSHQKWKELAVVVISRDCSYQTRKAVFDCGATDYLPTPIVQKELQMKLRSIAAFARCDSKKDTDPQP